MHQTNDTKIYLEIAFSTCPAHVQHYGSAVLLLVPLLTSSGYIHLYCVDEEGQPLINMYATHVVIVKGELLVVGSQRKDGTPLISITRFNR